MIPIQVNRAGNVVILALGLACTPANGGKPSESRTTTTRSDTATVPAALSAPADSDAIKADLARIQGSPNAPVWVIEVSDFQCPYCKQWHDQTYRKLRDEYVSTGKIRLAYVNFPLAQHAHAGPAAEAAMCAGAQGKFWEMHDALFTSQDKWAGLPSTAAHFHSLAQATGVNLSRWLECVRSGKMRPWIQADHDRAERAGAASTPSFMIGDQLLVGAQPIENMRSAIDSALAKSRKTTP
jgi:protein-disulfide isomerase